ncbi:MAG: phosphatidylglycerol lysyltransferase domain-containing protein [Muribaculaceae bacterium]|nr:phosphatidylglycerol lysyltransferase domain-containing protein [Muribaculaceae bacterium]
METTLISNRPTVISTVPATILKFRKAGMNDMETLLHFISEYPSRSCDFSVGGVLLWTDYFDYEICVIADTLFLKGRDERGVFFHKPLGSLPENQSLELIKDYCDAYAISSRIIQPQECTPENIEECAQSHADYLPDWREYVYDIEQFLKFSGKKMEKKRNHLNYFMNHFSDYEMEILDGSQTVDLIDFNDKFNLYHKEGDTFDYESSAIGKAIENYTQYPFFGLLLRYEGRIIGYTFGEPVGDTFIIHAEKGDIEYRGVYQALSSLLSREIQKKFPEVKFLNREDDMGNEYLRQSKLSYHPTKFIAKWEISA